MYTDWCYVLYLGLVMVSINCQICSIHVCDVIAEVSMAEMVPMFVSC